MDSTWRLILIGGISIFLVLYLIYCIRAGKIYFGPILGPIEKSKNPVLFFIFIALHIAATVLMITTGVLFFQRGL